MGYMAEGQQLPVIPISQSSPSTHEGKLYLPLRSRTPLTYALWSQYCRCYYRFSSSMVTCSRSINYVYVGCMWKVWAMTKRRISIMFSIGWSSSIRKLRRTHARSSWNSSHRASNKDLILVNSMTPMNSYSISQRYCRKRWKWILYPI